MRNTIIAAIVSLTLISHAQQCTVDWNDMHQRIDGFGASCAFSGRTWLASTADDFFSTNTGIGLSLLRNRIQPTGTASASELGLMQMAKARGAKVWSAPWSPPTIYKTTTSLNSGFFAASAANYQGYANQLASYVVQTKNSGVDVYAVSIQNEPDATNLTYEACGWTAQEFHDFVPYLYNALAASNVASTKIMLPEGQHWESGTNLYTTAMNDPNVAAKVGILANHNYDGPNPQTGSTATPVALPAYGKALWQTEVMTTDAFDGSITNAMYWATRIHLFLTAAQVNSWQYWVLIAGSSSNSGLENIGDIPAKRMYVLGQYSRFVRPDYYRIGVNNPANTLISAYKDPVTGNFAIVAVNTNATTAVNQTFNLNNFTNSSSVTPWITSSNLSLAGQTPVAVTGSSFIYTLPALSVVTFVGQAGPSNTAPTLAPVADQTINAGANLMVTNTATDPDVPQQTFSFNLLTGPTNAILTPLDATNALFTWRPPVSQAGTTNQITVKVVDSGSPALSATNRFNVIVNPLSPIILSSVGVSQGQVSFTVNGIQGPDYTVLTSTNLTGWQALWTTNSPVPPFTFIDTNCSDPVRFYRIQIGP
ncbi:MAG: hypothetical protein ABSH15_01645 [Verrucomicrobiota bacterium]|jgi:glucuronoarabinoxylan endo-1,4-beta-xylanase